MKMIFEEFLSQFVQIAKESYIKVYGLEKWTKLTEQEKHDLVIFLANDFRRKK